MASPATAQNQDIADQRGGGPLVFQTPPQDTAATITPMDHESDNDSTKNANEYNELQTAFDEFKCRTAYINNLKQLELHNEKTGVLVREIFSTDNIA